LTPVSEKVGRNFGAAAHHLVGRHRKAKHLFVKLDRNSVADAEHVPVVFAPVVDAVLGK
jgi:hypothetical protein